MSRFRSTSWPPQATSPQRQPSKNHRSGLNLPNKYGWAYDRALRREPTQRRQPLFLPESPGRGPPDVVRRIGQVIERRPDTCPHCGGAVEVMPELSLAEYARILRTLAGIVFSEPAVDEPIQVNVVAPAGHIPSEAAQ